MFASQNVVLGIPHFLQKTELKLVKPLPRKSQNTLSVGKQANKLVNTITQKRDIVETSNFLHSTRVAQRKN